MKITTPDGYVIEVSKDELDKISLGFTKSIQDTMDSLQGINLNNSETDNTSNMDKHKLIRDVIERKPEIPDGQQTLYSVLFSADEDGLDYSTLAIQMKRTEKQLSGILGALGRRINNTKGIEGDPGVPFLLTYKNSAPPNEKWGWAMSLELKQVLENGNYNWLKS